MNKNYDTKADAELVYNAAVEALDGQREGTLSFYANLDGIRYLYSYEVEAELEEDPPQVRLSYETMGSYTDTKTTLTLTPEAPVSHRRAGYHWYDAEWLPEDERGWETHRDANDPRTVESLGRIATGLRAKE